VYLKSKRSFNLLGVFEMQTSKRPDSRSRFSVCRLLAAASALLTLLVLLSPSQLRAQLVTGDVLGTVTDSTGAVVPGAKVTLTNTGTGIARSMISGDTGEFVFSNQQIGTFKVVVEANGFKSFSVANIALTAGQRLRVEAKLQVGSQVETVQVEASAAVQLASDSSNISSEIATSNMVELPTNGRNYYSLVGLMPGVKSGGGSGDPTDSRPSMDFTANGQSSYYNNNMIDGMDNNMVSLGTVAVEPSLDALEQVQVETSNYSAEYSRTGGGIANLITKSGTNAFHGSAFEFMRNDAFDAYPWTATTPTKSKLRQNQFGVSIGGPIIKNKAFFFADYQGWRQIEGSVKQQMLMTVDDWNAVHDFESGDNQSMVLTDPFGVGTVTVKHGTFENSTNGTVMAHDVNGWGLAQLMAEPYPTETAASHDCANWDGNWCGGQYNWVGSQNNVQNATTYDGRIDYHFNDKNTLFGRFSHNLTTTTGAGQIPEAQIVSTDSHMWAGHESVNPVADNNMALDYVHIFNPTTIFEAKASFNRAANSSHTKGTEYWSTEKVGIATVDGYDPASLPGMGAIWGGIQPAKVGPYAPAGPSATPRYLLGDMDGGADYFIQNTYQYVASMTMNRGSHSIKTGLTVIRRHINSSNAPSGGPQFSSIYTGNALSDIAEGLAVSVSANMPLIAFHGRYWEPSVYFQDDWRITKSLTLNLGVRYDVYTPQTAREGGISNFDLDSSLIVSPKLLGANSSGPTAGVMTDWKNISPRLGFAYTLPGNNKVTSNMVLRGGMGLSYFPGNSGTMPGSHEYQLLNSPFLWSMACGNAAYYGALQCGSDNGYMTSDQYNAHPYAISSSLIGADGASGYDMKYGLPGAKFVAENATDTSKYVKGFGANLFMMPNFRPSYLYQANLQVQKQIGNNIVTAGFVGNLGRRMPSFQNLNTPTSAAAYHSAPNAQSSYPLAGDHAWMVGVPVGESISEGNSSWMAGEATYERKMTGGLTASVNYTWARTESQSTSASYCSSFGCQVDGGSGSAITMSGWQQYGWSGSTSHRVAGIVSYQIPFGRNLTGPLGAVVKGWQLAGTGNWNTGGWSTVTSAIDQSTMGNLPTVNMNGGTEYPSRNFAEPIKPRNQSFSNWINPKAFKLQPYTTLGNATNPTVQGPRSRNVDLGLSKTFSMWENFKLQFRAEAFNFTNTPNFSFGGGGGPGGPPPGGGGGASSGPTKIANFCNPNDATECTSQAGPDGAGWVGNFDNVANQFGVISSASSKPRILQFGLRLIY
jgi:hypothetical protein